jgi:hypothetical protein
MLTRTRLNVSLYAYCISSPTLCHIFTKTYLPVWSGIRLHSYLQAVNLYSDMLSEIPLCILTQLCTSRPAHGCFESDTSPKVWFVQFIGENSCHTNCVFPENDNTADDTCALTCPVVLSNRWIYQSKWSFPEISLLRLQLIQSQPRTLVQFLQFIFLWGFVTNRNILCRSWKLFECSTKFFCWKVSCIWELCASFHFLNKIFVTFTTLHENTYVWIQIMFF